MLFPIGDDNRQISGPALVKKGLVLANLVVFFLLQRAGANEAFTYGWSVIPMEITHGIDLIQAQAVHLSGQSVQIPQAPGPTPIYLTILSAMFMHGGYLHIFGNMLYLWIFGDNVEHRFGSLAFLAFYLASGIAASVAQIALSPDSVIPSLGASGAISGVLGAYLVLFPKNRVRALLFYIIVSVPAVVVIGLWIVFQFVNGYGAIMVSEETLGGVAYGAHVGGFLTGVVLAFLLRAVIPFPERPNVLERAEGIERERRGR
ncbi:MAG TPA: rhomboid family intramembrane serine protease [Rhodothermales bacterium]|nr:rhomboid family intramembrane serine protease [Rhodothermales bacterium]